MFSGRFINSVSLQKLESILHYLSHVKCWELCRLLRCFPEVFGDAPSRTDWLQHDIDVGDAKLINGVFTMLHLRNGE